MSDFRDFITRHLLLSMETIALINMTQEKNTMSVSVFISKGVRVDWQFEQMCSAHWQHDIHFTWSIWHVWVPPCILSWCAEIEKYEQPHSNHSLLSRLHQYENVFISYRKKNKTKQTKEPRKTGAVRHHVIFFISIFRFSFLWFLSQFGPVSVASSTMQHH